MEQDSEQDKPVFTVVYVSSLKGEGMLGTSTCSSDRRVNFTGGYVIGAGLYDGCKKYSG